MFNGILSYIPFGGPPQPAADVAQSSAVAATTAAPEGSTTGAAPFVIIPTYTGPADAKASSATPTDAKASSATPTDTKAGGATPADTKATTADVKPAGAKATTAGVKPVDRPAKKCGHCRDQGRITVHKYSQCGACDGVGGIRCACPAKYSRFVKACMPEGWVKPHVFGAFYRIAELLVEVRPVEEIAVTLDMNEARLKTLVDVVFIPHFTTCVDYLSLTCVECGGTGSLDLGKRDICCPKCT